MPALAALSALFIVAPVRAQVLYTDTGSPTNPPWSQIRPTLNVEAPDSGPVYGSVINVNNAAVEVGLYGDRPISVRSQRLHVPCHTSTTSFGNFTRWFQTDGNTHVIRLFVNDENTATDRTNTVRTEVFHASGWNYADNVTFEWTGRYTVAHRQQGYMIFQSKNDDNDWSVSLSLTSSGRLIVNNRVAPDVTVTNLNGSVRNFDGLGFDVRVLDDGLFYKVWIDGVLYASNSYARPTAQTKFRWGSYLGAGTLVPPSDYNLILVSGVQIKSWPGNLATATTTITKANNTTSLDTGSSWVGGVTPGLYNQARWNSTVAGANTTTLGSDQTWAGIKIVNPGGLVTINGSAILSLDASGLDMSAATQDLVVNCPVQMPVSSLWNVAAGRTATFGGIISGYPGLTLNGGGVVLLRAANSYRGNTIVSNGTLVANHNSALGAGSLLLNGGSLSNSASCTLGNEVQLNASAIVGVAASQNLTLSGVISGANSLTKTGTGTLTLSGANTYVGLTTVNAGTVNVEKKQSSANGGWLIGSSSTAAATVNFNSGSTINVAGDKAITLGASGVGAKPTLNVAGTVVNNGSLNVNRRTSTLNLNSGANWTQNGNMAIQPFPSTSYSSILTVNSGATFTYTGSSAITLAPSGNNSGGARLNIFGGTFTTGQKFANTSSSTAGTGTADINFSHGGTLKLSASIPDLFTTTGSTNKVSLGTGGGVVDTAGFSTTLRTIIEGSGSLTLKSSSGSGTLTLSGVNTYSGDTTIQAGTLAIQVASLATNSTVSIAQGAVLRLDFTTTNTVAGLVTNGVALPPGVYNLGNAAPFIVGTGSLKVAGTVPPPPPIIAPVTVSGTNLVVSVPTVSGANYVLQSATNLTQTIHWQNESTNVGTGGSLILDVPIQPGKQQKYLRFWGY